MPRIPWATYFWPGLPQLWMRGTGSALLTAFLAAVLLNAVLLLNWGWSELMPSGFRTISWGAIGAFWVVSAVMAYTQRRHWIDPSDIPPEEDHYAEIRDLYLKGDYYQAERLSNDVLHHCERDIETRLLLVGLLRRTKRYPEALKHLEVLSRFESAERWRMEIQRERQIVIDLHRGEENDPPVVPTYRVAEAKQAA